MTCPEEICGSSDVVANGSEHNYCNVQSDCRVHSESGYWIGLGIQMPLSL